MPTTVVNLRFCRDAYDAKIDRMTQFGNPFKIGVGCTRNESVDKYRVWFYDKIATDPAFKATVLRLKGKRLACWCAPQLCHGDIIVEYLDSIQEKKRRKL